MMSLGFVFHRQCCWLAVQKGSSSLGQVIGDAMLTVGERSCDHATPRQMALLEEEIVVSPTFKDTTPGVIEEFCRNSNFWLKAVVLGEPFHHRCLLLKESSYASKIVCMPQRSDVDGIDASSCPGRRYRECAVRPGFAL